MINKRLEKRLWLLVVSIQAIKLVWAIPCTTWTLILCQNFSSQDCNWLSNTTESTCQNEKQAYLSQYLLITYTIRLVEVCNLPERNIKKSSYDILIQERKSSLSPNQINQLDEQVKKKHTCLNHQDTSLPLTAMHLSSLPRFLFQILCISNFISSCRASQLVTDEASMLNNISSPKVSLEKQHAAS